jgi:membrane-bound hydrogenase subunit beta
MTMNIEDYPKAIQDAFPGKQIIQTRPRRFWIDLKPEELRDAVKTVKEKFGIFHLSTICGEDMRDHILANYFMSGEVCIALRVRMDHKKPAVPTLADVIPGAIPYERELRDMFGVDPVGNPDPRRATLPEDWPVGVYPLRKDCHPPRAGESWAVAEAKSDEKA